MEKHPLCPPEQAARKEVEAATQEIEQVSFGSFYYLYIKNVLNARLCFVGPRRAQTPVCWTKILLGGVLYFIRVSRSICLV